MGVTRRSARVPLWAGDDLEIWTKEARLTRGAHGKNDKGPFSAHARSNRPGKVKTTTEPYRQKDHEGLAT